MEVLSEIVVTQLRSDPYLQHLQVLGDNDLNRLVGEILGSLILSADGEADELHRATRVVGELCASERVPLFEAAYGVYVVRDKIVDFLKHERRNREEDYDPDEELEHRVGRFFDSLVLSVLKN